MNVNVTARGRLDGRSVVRSYFPVRSCSPKGREVPLLGFYCCTCLQTNILYYNRKIMEKMERPADAANDQFRREFFLLVMSIKFLVTLLMFESDICRESFLLLMFYLPCNC